MITSSEIHRKAKNIHQNGRINEFYEDHEQIDRFDEYILSMKRYKPRKVAKIGQNHKKMPKLPKIRTNYPITCGKMGLHS